MAYDFLAGDRDQPFLLPWTRATGSPKATWPGSCATWSTNWTWRRSIGRTGPTGTATPPTTPKVLLGVLLYACATGLRSSRQIERRCREDLALRVLAGDQAPDHVTIARFRARHQQALAGSAQAAR